MARVQLHYGWCCYIELMRTKCAVICLQCCILCQTLIRCISTLASIDIYKCYMYVVHVNAWVIKGFTTIVTQHSKVYYTDTFNYKSIEVMLKWYTVAPVHFNDYLLFLQFSKQTVIDCYLSFVENYKTSGKVIENALTTKSSVQKFIEVSFCKRSIIFSRMTKWELIGEC